MSESLSFDIVILGAGPAGSAAAVTARRAGLSVALIDKATFPRDKLCGGLVSGRGQKALAALIGPLDPALFHPARPVRFQWGDEVLADFDAPRDQTYTMRIDFDAALFRAAEAAGAVTFTGQRGVEIGAGAVTLADGRALRFGVLIGADGVNSQVARALFGRAFDPDTIGFALEAEAPLDVFPADPVMMIDFAAVDWGYGWSFPKHASRTIGVGGVQGRNPDMKARMQDLLRLDGVDPDAVRVKGHFIPFGDFRKVPGKGNVMLVGDAAGLVDPLTGEGIAYALESGAAAADVAVEVLAEGCAGEAARRLANRFKPFHAELTRANRLRRYAFSGTFRNLFRDRLRTSERMRRVFFELLDGDTTYAEIERMAVKSTFGRLAGKLGRKG